MYGTILPGFTTEGLSDEDSIAFNIDLSSARPILSIMGTSLKGSHYKLVSKESGEVFSIIEALVGVEPKLIGIFPKMGNAEATARMLEWVFKYEPRPAAETPRRSLLWHLINGAMQWWRFGA